MKIIAFPYHDWRKADVEGMRWRDGHILERLGQHSAVEALLVVDRPTSLAERAIRRGATARGEPVDVLRRPGVTARLTNVRDRTWVLDVGVGDVVGPLRDRYRWWFDVFRRRQVLDAIDWAAGKLADAPWTAIAWMPTVAPAIERIGPSAFVFDSLDNWLLHPELRRYAPLAAQGYERLLGRADAVLVSAPRSRDALAQWSDEIEVVPNGVDPAVFAARFERPVDLPARPIVGYAGSVGPRIDDALVRLTARATPEASFVFIGQVLDKGVMKRLLSEPNVVYLGDRHYSEVPAYIKAFDVAWIPHSIGSGESGGDPIKMYEYWAAGREVVATRIDGLERWAARLHLVDDAGEAGTVIAGLLSGAIRPLEATVPEDRTWKAITELVLDRLSRAR